MSKAYKNFWSLNTDEAVVTGILRDETDKDVEILMPLNAQMKGVDLVLMNIRSRISTTIQVKGSRAFEPRKSEVKKFGPGSAGWFLLSSDSIDNASADYFIFLIYIIEEIKKIGRRILVPHTLVIPTFILKKLVIQHKKVPGKNKYNFIIWINPDTKEAFDFSAGRIDLSDYLDQKGYEILNKSLSK